MFQITDKNIAALNSADLRNLMGLLCEADLRRGNAQSRAILVIDKCQTGVHRQLSEIARASGSTISVITPEYDRRGR